ncbi:hypothetical protein EC902281_4270, partial [Escherichia coli 90.2281]
MHINIILKFSL